MRLRSLHRGQVKRQIQIPLHDTEDECSADDSLADEDEEVHFKKVMLRELQQLMHEEDEIHGNVKLSGWQFNRKHWL